MKRPVEWEKIFANLVSEKDYYLTYIKILYNWIAEKMIKNGQRNWMAIFPKMTYKWEGIREGAQYY